MSSTKLVGFAAWCTAAAISVIAAVPDARADVITLSSVRDNTLYQDATGSLSNGAGEGFFAGNTTAGLTRRGLVRFDLASLPIGATITNVTLTLHMSMTSTGATNVSLHRVLADWARELPTRRAARARAHPPPPATRPGCTPSITRASGPATVATSTRPAAR